jgi:hypothetical protein
MGWDVRSARLNRWRAKFGLVPLPRAGQVWHVEYAEWPAGADPHRYYLLLRPGGVDEHEGKKTERWHVLNLEDGSFYGDPFDIYAMPFEYEHGERQRPYYRLVSEAP